MRPREASGDCSAWRAWRRGLRRSPIVSIAAAAMLAVLAAGCSTGTAGSTGSTTTTAGMSAAAVRVLQVGLTKVGCYTGSIDGVNGSATKQALRAFQSATGLSVDGIDGPKTQSTLAAAQNAGTKICSTSGSTTTTARTGTTTTAASGVPAAATAAINSYETANGPAAGTWQITSSQVSKVDPSYVYFQIGPTAGHETTVQGGYGFAHLQSGTWSVIGFGSAQVGCPPGAAGNAVVPSTVLAEFGFSCPPAS